MSNRLNQDKESQLQPTRTEYAMNEIEKKGYKVTRISKAELNFIFKDKIIKLFPYSGWHAGKGITDGRGINNLLKQI